MNDAVKRRLEKIKGDVSEIKNLCDLILKDINDVEDDSEDLYVIENNLNWIWNKAQNTYDYVRSTYDYFEE